MLFIYRLIINLILFISPFIVLIRIIKKKEDFKRVKEKYCFFTKKRKPGNIIWFHGASVGEIQSVVPLFELLNKNKNIAQILVTTNTFSSSKIINDLKIKKITHQFFPIDNFYLSNKFLNYWKPSKAIFVDSEVWPNIITNLNRKKIQTILLNGRISEKSFKRWLFFKNFSKKIFEKFDLCLASNYQSYNYLKILGSKNVKYYGNLKFAESQNEKGLDNHLKNFFKSKKVFCGSSTHPGEEKMCGIVHKKIKKNFPNLITVIIPRHIERVNKIINQLEALDLKVYLHHPRNKIPSNTDIYLVNTYGENKLFLKEFKFIFLGGSLNPHGGQNPLEAARYGCHVIHGPHTWNFKEIYSLLNNLKVSSNIGSAEAIIKKLKYFFKQKEIKKRKNNKIQFLGKKILRQTYKTII